ncbi:MFS general substrate transporter [Bimuria novae-zelandiae CBS 107.79]|uniref:MFS general substrate transporter n=1 Tax=Bimuria novae-zelandiae CBS 107.79 TaxID=1447943 RepID=A0A6A5URF8_9PLEO|nr:MFS general substrate transporter [Bimuria novae-zelandiae CBS 107.79]
MSPVPSTPASPQVWSRLDGETVTNSPLPTPAPSAHFPDAVFSTSKDSSEEDQRWRREEGFWRSFIAICIPLLLSALEGSVTNTALPTISDALNLGTQFSWVATAFLLASTIFQPLYGQLGDMWGRKYPMMTAVAVFFVGSAICGWANSGAVLIFGRIVQGLGTGGIDLFAEMILCDIIPLRKRGPYLAIKHAVFAIGTTLGSLLGGVFAEHNWRLCFWINMPVCLLSLVIMYFWLHVGGGITMRNANFREEIKNVDICGTALLTASVIMLLVALSTGGASHPWDHPAIVTSLAFSLLGFITFALFQRSKHCAHPIMPKEVFSNRTTNIAFSLTTIHGFITYGFQFYLPPFFQAVKGSSPMQSGLEILPTTLVIVVLAAAGGPLLTFWGNCMTLGLGLWIMLERGWPLAAWLCLQLLPAVGCGIVVSSMLPAVQVKLPDTTTGQSSGSWAFLRGTGSLFGVAIPGAIFNVRFASLLPSISSEAARARLEKGQAYQRATSAFIKSFEPRVQTEIVHVFVQSLKCVWILYTVLAGIGLLTTPFEKEHKMRKELNSAYGLKTQKCAGQTPANTRPASPAMTPGEERIQEDIELAGSRDVERGEGAHEDVDLRRV